MNLRRFTLLATLVLASPFAFVAAAHAQAYPSKPIKLLVPLAAGSTADILSRTIGTELAREMGQAVVVENKAGAGGTIAMAELARSAPDGYTIAFASQGTLVFNQALYSKPGYDSIKDFAPIVLVGGVSNVMIVPPGSTAKTVMDVITAAKAKPGMTFSSGGSGTSHHLSGVLFGQLTGTQLTHVPYKGAPQGILAVMSGEVDMGFYNTPTVIAQIRENKVKGLGVTSLAKSELLPQLPTLDSSGVKAYEVNTWFGFVAPAGTPPEVVTRLHATIGKILALPAIREKLAAQGFDLAPLQPPAHFATVIQADLAKWPTIVKASGAKVD
ncbi:tripartite tricarboxylate transporter substrate binding protein [Caenimonas sedimenti]|uniref:Tripartite tricarboxylate transporter substrate binding protein n=1 Tax=Caenimonas sedimenti TaxID=2596921 RepID=A0A562ZLC3_9BURK|nr:tripartite tricarboxylate transporter substrate binding protein [Caenimonas sedimenti]TWO68974.1 tripartite tricarboxylate transporter substrate binding protein [Caenimonas sedimenti]